MAGVVRTLGRLPRLLPSSFTLLPSSTSLRHLSTSPTTLTPMVQKPAPAFKAQAVVDGQFKEVKAGGEEKEKIF